MPERKRFFFVDPFPYQGASTTCLRILPDAETFPISSGVENGVELLLDLETFDNGEFGVDEDALKILVADQHDHPLLDLNGFIVKPDDLVELDMNSTSSSTVKF